jgi:hypothetical protein
VLVDETHDENRISDRVLGDGIRPIMSLSTRRVCLGSTGRLISPSEMSGALTDRATLCERLLSQAR